MNRVPRPSDDPRRFQGVGNTPADPELERRFEAVFRRLALLEARKAPEPPLPAVDESGPGLLKLADGTLLLWGRWGPQPFPGGGVLGTIVFPRAFAEPPTVVLSAETSGDFLSSEGARASVFASPPSADRVNWKAELSGATSLSVAWSAIGRWK